MHELEGIQALRYLKQCKFNGLERRVFAYGLNMHSHLLLEQFPVMELVYQNKC